MSEYAIHGVPGGSVMWKAPAGSCTSSDAAVKAAQKKVEDLYKNLA